MNNMDDESRDSHLVFRFKPIFQADFAYVRKTDDKTFSLEEQTYDFFDEQYKCDVNLSFSSAENEFIIPVTTVTFAHKLAVPELSMRPHRKYYIVDPSSNITLYNVNGWNRGDNFYSYSNDVGAFFSQTDYFYSAKYLKKGTVNWAESADILFNTIAYGYDIIDSTNLFTFTSVLKYFPIIDKVYTTVDLIKSIKELQGDFAYSVAGTQKDASYHGYHTNADRQKQEYHDLLTSAAIAITAYDDQYSLLYGTGDWGEFDYQICAQQLTNDTRYSATFNFGVVGITTKNKFEVNVSDVFWSTSSFSNNLCLTGNSTYKEIPVVNAVDGEATFSSQILSNYYNLIKFVPDKTGYYDIKGNYKNGDNSRLGFAVYEARNNQDYENLGTPLGISENASKEHLWLESGKTYYVKSDLKSGAPSDGFYYGEFSLDFYMAKHLQVGNNTLNFYGDYAYAKVNADSSQYYCVSASGCTVDLVDNQFNVIEEASINGTILNNGDEQYYRINRPSSSINSVNVVLTTKRHIVLDPANGEDEIEWWVINCNYPDFPIPAAKEGYDYIGWCRPGNNEVYYTEINIGFIDEADIVLIADWAKTYKVHYNTQEWNESIPDDVFNERWNGVLKTNILRPGYSFGGWYLNPQCDAASRIYFFPAGTNTDQTVYAKWEQTEFFIRFKVDGVVKWEFNSLKTLDWITTPFVERKYYNGRWRSAWGNVVGVSTPYSCKGYDEIFEIEWLIISPYTESFKARNEQYTITDSGVFNQRFDNVFSFTNEHTSTYRTARIVIQFTAWEKDDGYQHVMLYDGSGSGATLLGERQFEHGGSKKDTNPADYEFVFEIDLLYMTNKNLCVRYSASGFGADTWYNAAMTGSITFYE